MTNAATTFIDERSGVESREDAQNRVEAFWRSRDVTPREGRSTDAQSLRFTLQYVVAIVSTALVMAGAIWAANYGLRSDVRDILTRIEAQGKLDEVKAKLEDERRESLKGRMDAYEREQRLLRLEFQQFREQLLFKTKGVLPQ